MFKRGRTVRLTATEDAWAAPTMMALEGGSFGLRIGAEETDFVLLVTNESGARGILAGKVKLGGDASIAAGLVGRDASAETDVTMRSEILSYSHARGVFAGISLEGSTVRPDNDANEKIYGEKLPARDIAFQQRTTSRSSRHAVSGGCLSSFASSVPGIAGHRLPIPRQNDCRYALRPHLSRSQKD